MAALWSARNFASRSRMRRLRCPMTRAGVPATIANSGTLLLTKLRAPTETATRKLDEGACRLDYWRAHAQFARPGIRDAG